MVQVQALPQCSGLRILYCCSYGIGHSYVSSLAWELLYAVGVDKKKKKKKNLLDFKVKSLDPERWQDIYQGICLG